MYFKLYLRILPAGSNNYNIQKIVLNAHDINVGKNYLYIYIYIYIHKLIPDQMFRKTSVLSSGNNNQIFIKLLFVNIYVFQNYVGQITECAKFKMKLC